ncbi:MAG: WhiB family transcriptional regulator [Mycobacteriales bacterium]
MRAGGDWRRRGACLTVDPEIFFPVAVGEAANAQLEQAKAICRGCAVSVECLDWALGVRELEGVWGGTAPAERLAMLRERRSISVRA